MRRTIRVLLICVPMFVLFLSAPAQGLGLEERNALIAKLGVNISRFLEKESRTQKLTSKDKAVALGIMRSLRSDPPLKTIEERIALAALRKVDTVMAEYQNQEDGFNERIEELIKRQYKNRVPTITPYQRYDLSRLIQLNDVFRKYHWYSEPIGKLFAYVFEEIDRTTQV